jgi:NADH-quinone oxidoreductase subunit E
MLTELEQAEIEREISHYPDKRAGCVEALKVVQRHRAWVSDESLRDVAALLDMTPDEVDGVATFYNLIFRKPVGRHVLFVCNSVSCWVMGHERVRERIEGRLGVRLGETTADGRFTLLPIVCLGACESAPVMMIGTDLHRQVKLDELDAILERYQ